MPTWIRRTPRGTWSTGQRQRRRGLQPTERVDPRTRTPLVPTSPGSHYLIQRRRTAGGQIRRWRGDRSCAAPRAHGGTHGPPSACRCCRHACRCGSSWCACAPMYSAAPSEIAPAEAEASQTQAARLTPQSRSRHRHHPGGCLGAGTVAARAHLKRSVELHVQAQTQPCTGGAAGGEVAGAGAVSFLGGHEPHGRSGTHCCGCDRRRGVAAAHSCCRHHHSSRPRRTCGRCGSTP